jgi:hypothetical protein
MLGRAHEIRGEERIRNLFGEPVTGILAMEKHY